MFFLFFIFWGGRVIQIKSNQADGSQIFRTDMYICSKSKNHSVKLLFITPDGMYHGLVVNSGTTMRYSHNVFCEFILPRPLILKANVLLFTPLHYLGVLF